ncbi:flavodoxin [Listeria welshimeri]|nr:flavodoxin [Listeria welshimeri]
MTAVVVFFSRNGENFINGKKQEISVGNTEVVARKIADQLNIDLIKLEEIETYSFNYDETVNRAEKEKLNGKRVAYHSVKFNREKIDTLFLGYPNWWGSYPRVIATFLEEIDTMNLTIFPFCTHEGSAMGGSLEELKKQCPNAMIKCGLPIRGSRVERSDVAITNWLLAYE